MTCGEVEILLCDYQDGTLRMEERSAVERHLSGCATCASLDRDAAAAGAFMDRAADVEPPPHLLTKIIAETTSGKHGRLGGAAGGVRQWLAGLLAPILQPRLVMGMALTVFSFSMMARCAGVSPRQLTAADLEPAKVYSALDDRAHRSWNRTMQFYESVRFIYDMKSRLSQLTEQQEEEDRNTAAQRPVEDHRVPPPAETKSQQ
jgi:anti-sigma factor RsiW